MSDKDRGRLENPFGYAEAIWQRFLAPARAGEFAPQVSGVVTGQAGTPAARSVLRIQFQFADGRVADSRFRAYGCPTSIAVGGWVADWSIGKSPDDLRDLTVVHLRTALEIPDDRAHCAFMGQDAVRAAVAQLPQSSSPRELP